MATSQNQNSCFMYNDYSAKYLSPIFRGTSRTIDRLLPKRTIASFCPTSSPRFVSCPFLPQTWTQGRVSAQKKGWTKKHFLQNFVFLLLPIKALCCSCELLTYQQRKESYLQFHNKIFDALLRFHTKKSEVRATSVQWFYVCLSNLHVHVQLFEEMG